MKILTVGPVPPEWGGPNAGGVATFHRMLLERLDGHDVATISIGTPPVPVHTPAGGHEDRWYADLAASVDVVLMLHVAHRWATYHARQQPAPAVAAVRSWTPVLKDPSKHNRIQEALDAMDALVFPSRAAVDQGLKLGFTYHVDPMVIHNALGGTFRAAVDLDRPRSGVVFVGAPNDIKRPWLAERAAAELNLPFRIVTGRPPDEVRDALLSSEVLCVPSLSESFGHVYIEAAACGTPSVGYGPTIAELSAAAGNPLGAGASGDITAVLRRVVSHRWDRNQLRSSVLAAFDPAVMAASYLKMMGQAASSR